MYPNFHAYTFGIGRIRNYPRKPFPIYGSREYGLMKIIPAIVIILPIVFPIAVATGIHPVHLGVVITMNLAIGLVTPPYGLCLLLATKIAGISIEKSFRGTLPYLAVMIGILFVATYFSPIVMFLPKLLLPQFIM